MLAIACGRHPVVEAALGAALLGAIGAGLAGRDDKWITVERRARPASTLKSTYDALFSIYKRLYPALKHDIHLLAGLRS